MKALLQISAIATLIVAISINLNASNINLVPEDEAYINDIPFSTEEVAANCLYEQALSESFEFEKEAYIDDIPFDTYEVAKNCIYEKYLKNAFAFEEEEYIEDIPFDTERIFNEIFFTVYYYSK
ncbi:MAG: hypothetical protein V2I62_07500 [Bacteroidales bacterium]|jgi:hypothetical protein|nr:hypothetical protein [Bacteroidales bacterium]